MDLADSLPEIIFETDKSGRITYVNKSALDLTGYNEFDMKNGLNVLQMVIPEEREVVRSNMLQFLSGEPFYKKDYTALRKDGTTFPILITAKRVIKDGEPVGIRGVIVDISERKKAETALKAQFDLINSIFEASPDGITIADLTGTIVDCNPCNA